MEKQSITSLIVVHFWYSGNILINWLPNDQNICKSFKANGQNEEQEVNTKV